MNNPMFKNFLFAGLGSFTTFSAFGLESFKLFYDQNMLVALASIGLQIVGGILLCGVGFRVASL